MGRKSRSKKSRPPGSPLLGRSKTTTFETVDRPASELAPPARQPYIALAVCGSLLLAVIVVFGQTRRYDFVNLDDYEYVYENRHVSGGLTGESVAWAMTAYYAANWHPLTWLSHMLDCELYDLWPGGHHLTNVFLHAATAILLFLALRRMTGAIWPSAWTAAIFAIHPLRVESVAWVAERKDVLSGLFFMLTLWCYARYVERPASWGRYLSVVASYAFGLTAKPMLVTLPFVLLLLDYWPLGRFGRRRSGAFAEPTGANDREKTWVNGRVGGDFAEPTGADPPYKGLIVEKIPLLVLAAALCVVTLTAQRHAIRSLDEQPLTWRVANAAVAYVAYLGKMFYPANLAVLYPLPKGPPSLWEAIAAFAVLLAISIAVFVVRRKRTYLLVGWLWYLGTLAPVIGLVQVGNQAMADRYTYLPQVGLYMAIAWGAAEMAGAWPYRRWVLAAASALIVAGLMICAWRQTRYWRDSDTLWNHALDCTSQNWVAHGSLGAVLARRGQVNDAIVHFREALAITPNYAEAHNNLGVALSGRGEVDEAITHFQFALELKPDYADAHNGLGLVLSGRGEVDEAIAHYQKALTIDSDYFEAHFNLGLALAGRGEVDEAIAHYRKALAIKPDYVKAHYRLGLALAGRGHLDEAITHFRKALEIEPDYIEAYNNLGLALAGRGRIDEAITQYRKAIEINPNYFGAHYNLGLALARRGEVDEAIAHYQKALESKPDFVEARNDLGLALVGRGQVDEAIAHYRKALESKPDHFVTHVNLGSALVGHGQLDEAIAHYRTALEIKPDCPQADAIREQINRLRR
jgi:protein O-mannosyl-transferase